MSHTTRVHGVWAKELRVYAKSWSPGQPQYCVKRRFCEAGNGSQSQGCSLARWVLGPRGQFRLKLALEQGVADRPLMGEACSPYWSPRPIHCTHLDAGSAGAGVVTRVFSEIKLEDTEARPVRTGASCQRSSGALCWVDFRALVSD